MFDRHVSLASQFLQSREGRGRFFTPDPESFRQERPPKANRLGPRPEPSIPAFPLPTSLQRDSWQSSARWRRTPGTFPKPHFAVAEVVIAVLPQSASRRRKTIESATLAARESGNSIRENARTTAQRARAMRSARQAELPVVFLPQEKSNHRPASESRAQRQHPPAERPPTSPAELTTGCDENREPLTATFRPAAQPSAPVTPTRETLATILQTQRRPPACPSKGAVPNRAIAPVSADRSGIESREAREQHRVLHRAILEGPAHRAAPSSQATEAPIPRCSRSPKTSIESWSRAGRVVSLPAKSALLSPWNSAAPSGERKIRRVPRLQPSSRLAKRECAVRPRPHRRQATRV